MILKVQVKCIRLYYICKLFLFSFFQFFSKPFVNIKNVFKKLDC